MQLFWFTNRSFSDLCSTTQLALANGIIKQGHELSIIGPGPEKTDVKWHHEVIKGSSVRGLQARTLGQKMAIFARNMPINREQKVVVLVHWSLVKYLSNELNKQGISWLIMDRSPPADSGFLAKLQKKVWVNAWNLVDEEYCKGGFVVSKNHHQLVENYCRKKLNNVAILPAGVDLTTFAPSNISPPSKDISFVYHGRIDKNRGILNMTTILQKISMLGHKSKLTLIGEGDAVNAIKKLALNPKGGYDIALYDKMPQRQLAQILSESNFGILPMPHQEVWAVASPLKRSEYLACGLLVFGIDHPGHKLSEAGSEYMGLFSAQEMATKGVDWVIASASSPSLAQAKNSARKYAEQHCSWDNSVYTLVNHLERAVE